MRPSKSESDLEYWTKAIQYWLQRIEYWFLYSAGARTPADKALAEEGERNAKSRLFAAELARQEALGEIVVYTGRPKPRWA